MSTLAIAIPDARCIIREKNFGIRSVAQSTRETAMRAGTVRIEVADTSLYTMTSSSTVSRDCGEEESN